MLDLLKLFRETLKFMICLAVLRLDFEKCFEIYLLRFDVKLVERNKLNSNDLISHVTKKI